MKCNQIITHQDQFRTKKSILVFDSMKEICKKLETEIILFQCPASFKATQENIAFLKNFFKKIDRKNLTLVWEPRGKSWNQKNIKEICKKFNIIHCVDLFRDKPLWFGKKKIAYFRLHGFGKPSMYNYNFSEEELKQLKKKIEELNELKEIWVFFNNVQMYSNALQFIKLLKK